MHQVVLKRAARSQCFQGWFGGGSSDRGGGDNFITDPFDGIGGGCDVPCVFRGTVPTQVYQAAFVLTVRPNVFPSSCFQAIRGRSSGGGAFTETFVFIFDFYMGANALLLLLLRKTKSKEILTQSFLFYYLPRFPTQMVHKTLLHLSQGVTSAY